MQPCIAVPHTARLVPPELGDEQHEDGVKLQTAQQHAQRQNPFGQRRDMAEVVHRPHAAEPRPHVGNAGQRRRERAHQIHVLHGQDNRTHCSNNTIQQEKANHPRDDFNGHGLPGDLEMAHGMGVQQAEDFQIRQPEQHHEAHDLDAAARGPSAAAHQHEHQNNDQCNGGPA